MLIPAMAAPSAVTASTCAAPAPATSGPAATPAPPATPFAQALEEACAPLSVETVPGAAAAAPAPSPPPADQDAPRPSGPDPAPADGAATPDTALAASVPVYVAAPQSTAEYAVAPAASGEAPDAAELHPGLASFLGDVPGLPAPEGLGTPAQPATPAPPDHASIADGQTGSAPATATTAGQTRTPAPAPANQPASDSLAGQAEQPAPQAASEPETSLPRSHATFRIAVASALQEAAPDGGDLPGATPDTGVATALTSLAGARAADGVTRPDAASTVAATDPASAEPSRLAETVVRGVQYLATHEEQTLRVRLMPPSLGELHIEVVRQGQTMEVRLLTPHQGVRHALDAQLADLRTAFQREGIAVSQVQVSMAPAMEFAGSFKASRGFTGGTRPETAAPAPGSTADAGVDAVSEVVSPRRTRGGALDLYV